MLLSDASTLLKPHVFLSRLLCLFYEALGPWLLWTSDKNFLCMCVCACVWEKVSWRHSGDASACRKGFYVMKLMQVMHNLSYGTWKTKLFKGIKLPALWQMTLWWGAIQSFQEDCSWSLSDPIPILLQRELDDLVSSDWMNYLCSGDDRRVGDQDLLLAVQEHLLPLRK